MTMEPHKGKINDLTSAVDWIKRHPEIKTLRVTPETYKLIRKRLEAQTQYISTQHPTGIDGLMWDQLQYLKEQATITIMGVRLYTLPQCHGRTTTANDKFIDKNL